MCDIDKFDLAIADMAADPTPDGETPEEYWEQNNGDIYS